MNLPQPDKHSVCHGIYPVRSLGHGESGIHLPKNLSGSYAIYEDETGIITLVPMVKS